MTSAFIQMKDGFYDLDSTLPACLRWKRETNGFWHVVDRAEYTAGLNSRIPSQSSNDEHPQTSESLMMHTRTHVMQINSKKLAKTTCCCCCCCCSIHQWWYYTDKGLLLCIFQQCTLHYNTYLVVESRAVLQKMQKSTRMIQDCPVMLSDEL